MLPLAFFTSSIPASACTFKCESIPSSDNVLVQEKMGSPEENGNHLNYEIAVWNMHKGNRRTFEREYLSLNADMVIGQEILLTKKFLELNQNRYLTLSTGFFMKKGKRTGTGIMSNLEPLSSKAFVSPEVERFGKAPKTITKNEYPYFTVYSVHGMTTKNVMKQMREIEGDLANTPSSVIVAGDFNTNRHKEIMALDNFMETLGLHRITKGYDGKFLVDHVYTRGINLVGKVKTYKTQASDHPIIKFKIRI